VCCWIKCILLPATTSFYPRVSFFFLPHPYFFLFFFSAKRTREILCSSLSIKNNFDAQIFLSLSSSFSDIEIMEENLFDASQRGTFLKFIKSNKLLQSRARHFLFINFPSAKGMLLFVIVYSLARSIFNSVIIKENSFADRSQRNLNKICGYLNNNVIVVL